MVSNRCGGVIAEASADDRHATVEERRVQVQTAARRRWQEQGTDSAERFLGTRRGAEPVAHLLGRNLAASTQAAYQHHWESFVAFCRLDNISALPATRITVACYIGHLYGKGTVRGGSVRPCRAR